MKKEEPHDKGLATLPGNPEDFYTLYPYLSVLSGQREYEKCQKLLGLMLDIVRAYESRARQKISRLAEFYRMAAENHLRIGEVKAAADLYFEGLQRFPCNGELCLGYGECLTRLSQFSLAEQALNDLSVAATTPDVESECRGLVTYRRDSALGELDKNRGRLDIAQGHFLSALNHHSSWIPAHIGLVETEVMRGNVQEAGQYLSATMQRMDRVPDLILCEASLALIISDFEKAQECAIELRGDLLGDDRFEYLLFKIDFFRADLDSLTRVPYAMRGETVETEAASIWMVHLNGGKVEANPRRIPEVLWQEEYDALDAAWKQMKHRGTLLEGKARST